MRVVSEEQLRELWRTVAQLMVEQESDGMAQHLPEQSTRQMPEVTRPHPLYGVTLGELREDGVDAVAKAFEESAPLGSGISSLGGVGCEQFDAHIPRQLFLGLGRVVVASPYDDPRARLDDLGDDCELVGVGRGRRDASDHPRPAKPHAYSEAVEGLFEENVLAKGGLTAATRAAVEAGEQASWLKGIESQMAKVGS